MINEILSIGVLLGSLVSPLVNTNADTSAESTSETTESLYSLASTGESFRTNEQVWCGDGDVYRPYIPITPLQDPFGYLDTTLGLNDSTKVKWYSTYWARNGTTGVREYPGTTATTMQKLFSYEGGGLVYNSVAEYIDTYGKYPYLNGITDGRGLYYENVYTLPLGTQTLEYWQTALDFSIIELTRYAPYNTSLDNYAVETASVCRPTITISANDDTTFKLTIAFTASSFRLFFYQDGTAVTSYPLNTNKSSISSALYIYPTSWIKTASNKTAWPINLRNRFHNTTTATWICGSEYALTSTEDALYGPKIGRGYLGLAPWYYGAQLNNANMMVSYGFAYLSPEYYETNNEQYQGKYIESSTEDMVVYSNKLNYNFQTFVCDSMDWSNLYVPDPAYMCLYGMNESNAIDTLELGVYSEQGGSSSSGGTDSSGTTYYVFNFNDFIFQMLAVPFAFLSQAFNVTLFEGTPYAINIVTILYTIIGVIIVVALVNLLIKAFKK